MIGKIKKISKNIYFTCSVLGISKGLKVGLLHYLSIITKKQSIVEKKHDIIRRFIDNEYSEKIVASNLCDTVIPCNLSENKINIWVFWYQDKEDMPIIVKKCYEQLCRTYSTNEYKIHLLTKNNLSNYIHFPSYIIEKVRNNEISLTHFSDILRFSLLYHFSGFWIDATVWCQGKIDENILRQRYWSIKLPRPAFTVSVTCYRWSTFILSFSKKHDPLAKMVLNLLLEYWKKEHFLVDYLLIDYFFEYAILKLDVGKDFLAIKESNLHLYDLAAFLSKTYSPDTWNIMKSNTSFFKLSYKGPLVLEALNNKKSYYYYVIKNKE